ncbi:MAG TPA: ABC transporter ATP-binding protein, partial [Patescibacteria group bacterium]|nr:ABC transporter ATP-binding protein [Patescibacteria group bacterium]
MKNIIKIILVSKPLYKILALIAFLIVLSAGLELAAPLVSKLIVDNIVSQISTGSGDLKSLTNLIILTFVLSFLGIIISGLSDRIGDHFAGLQRKFLTEKFYNKILSLPQTYFDSEMSGKIINQLSRGIGTIQNFTNAATNFILPSFLQSILIIVVLARYNPLIALCVFILFPIYLALSYYSSIQWGKSEVKKNKLEDILRGRLQEVIGNIRIVKGFLTEKMEYVFASDKLTEINKIFAVQSSTYHWIDFGRNFSLIVILLGINILIFYQTFNGAMTLGVMVLIIQLVLQARRPLFAMSFILTQLQNAESGSKEFFEILELPEKENFDVKNIVRKLVNPSLEFKNVAFNYSDSGDVLTGVSFKINPKEKVALVGHSGAGKTTITNLILKLYDPTGGEIMLSDKKFKDLGFREVRQNISLVFQENELFSTSIRENVAYGTRATESQIISAIKSANAWDFVQKLPHGIDSQIGE